MLQWKGCWTSERSVQHYLQLNFGAVGFASLPVLVQEKIRLLAYHASIVLNPLHIVPLSPMEVTARRAPKDEVGETVVTCANRALQLAHASHDIVLSSITRSKLEWLA
eukprot:6490353-Amphidinium_carterae.1